MMTEPDQWRLDGRNVLITGGSQGIGLAITRQMLERGANVALIARNRSRIEWVNAELIEAFPDADIHALCMDLSYPEELGAVGNWITGFWSQLDVLVNNIGTNIRKPATDFTLPEYQSLMEANLTSCFELSRLLHALMRRDADHDDDSSVINISSVAGLTHLRTGAPYAMSKAAMNQLTRNLACEWAQDRIRVNAIAPWYIETDLAGQVLKDKAYRDEVISRTPMARTGRPARRSGGAGLFSGDAGVFLYHRADHCGGWWFQRLRLLTCSSIDAPTG